MFRKFSIVLVLAVLLMLGMVVPEADAMYGLTKYWFSITDELGRPIVADYASIDILAYEAGTGTKATLYLNAYPPSPTTTGTKSQAAAWNPSTTGVAEFWCAETSLDITVTNAYATVKVSGFTVSDHQIQLRNAAPITNIDTTDIGATTPGTGAVTTLSTTDTATFGAAVIGSYETVTCTAGDPQGTGVLSTTKLISFVVTDNTGGSKDLVTLASDTATAGQLKIVVLKTDTETSGLLVTPAAFGRGTAVLLEDAGDGVMFVFDGATWQLCESDAQTIE